MSQTVKRFLSAVGAVTPSISKGELVVVSQPPTLASLTADIRKAHRECMEALIDSLRAAIEAGKGRIALKAELKKQKGHGLWQDYVSIECGLSIRTAQNYMHLAKHEATLAPLLSGNTQGSAFSQAAALKFLGEERKKRKRK
jgi:hypothetical protein